MPRIARQRDRGAPLDEESRVAAHLPMRADGDRHPEHRRLEHRVESRAMKPATHERRVRQRVEIRQDADAVHDDDRPGFRVLEL